MISFSKKISKKKKELNWRPVSNQGPFEQDIRLRGQCFISDIYSHIRNEKYLPLTIKECHSIYAWLNAGDNPEHWFTVWDCIVDPDTGAEMCEPFVYEGILNLWISDLLTQSWSFEPVTAYLKIAVHSEATDMYRNRAIKRRS